MATAKITLGGLYNFTDGNIFSGFTFPAGIESELVISGLLQNYGEMALIYVDPDALTMMIGYWCRRHYRTFQKWIDALNVEYEPLENYNRTEIHSGEDSTHTEGEASSSSGSDSNSDGITTVTSKPDTYTDHYRSSYNSSDLQKVEQSHQHSGSGNGNVTITDWTEKPSQHMESASESEGSSDETVTYGHQLHAYGNIGVTTSQQMLQSELDIAYWNIYDRICDIFADEFLIRIYD